MNDLKDTGIFLKKWRKIVKSAKMDCSWQKGKNMITFGSFSAAHNDNVSLDKLGLCSHAWVTAASESRGQPERLSSCNLSPCMRGVCREEQRASINVVRLGERLHAVETASSTRPSHRVARSCCSEGPPTTGDCTAGPLREKSKRRKWGEAAQAAVSCASEVVGMSETSRVVSDCVPPQCAVSPCRWSQPARRSEESRVNDGRLRKVPSWRSAHSQRLSVSR